MSYPLALIYARIPHLNCKRQCQCSCGIVMLPLGIIDLTPFRPSPTDPVGDRKES